MNIPVSTYRVQFNSNFTFKHFKKIIPYLHALGISTIYASPLLQAGKDSEHCYNVCDPTRLNYQIGTEEEFAEIINSLHDLGMSWLQDIVPNHMYYHQENVWLTDVLERGKNSPYSEYFDIDWQHPYFNGRVIAPFIGGELDDVLAKQQIKLSLINNEVFLSYFDNHYPVNVGTLRYIINEALPEQKHSTDQIFEKLKDHIYSPLQTWNDKKKEVIQGLFSQNKVSILHAIERINTDTAALKNILAQQHYVLCNYRDADVHINYRRFFSINSLICLNMDNEKVFAGYHEYTLNLYKQGLIDGLRIDHIDGLKDPVTYLNKLKDLFGSDCYIIIEKILDVKEKLPASLHVEGTSGYEFLSYINQLVTDMQGADKLLNYYNKLMPAYKDYDKLVYRNKLDFFKTNMQGEWENLLALIIAQKNIIPASFNIERVKEALAVFIASFPVYRIYANKFPLDDTSSHEITIAFEQAFNNAPSLKIELLALRNIFEYSVNDGKILIIQRMMQFSGPLAAKGIEDTTFYNYNPLISHNEVGDQPCILGIPINAFHEKMKERHSNNPVSMNCTATHDTKRGEDSRIRINLLSELPDEWIALVNKLNNISAKYYHTEKEDTPVLNDRYFLYQSLVGSLPQDLCITTSYIERTNNFFIKALREGKVSSTHQEPATAYEAACTNFIKAILTDKEFTAAMIAFVKKIHEYAAVYSLAQVVIKSTAPGIPDFYQGCELWDLSYVDPDNRQPVDFDLRKKMLAVIKQKEALNKDDLLQWLTDNKMQAAQKLYTTYKMLWLRNNHKALFIKGAYVPVVVEHANRTLLCYARHYKNEWLLVVIPLNIYAATHNTLQLQLPDHFPATWKNVFTNDIIKINNETTVQSLLKSFPVAVFVSTEEYFF